MTTTPWFHAALAALALTAACKQEAHSNSGLADSLPVRVGDPGDATVATKVGILGQGGGKKLTLDLTRLPPKGGANVWACGQVPPDSFAIGHATCVDDVTRSVEVVAANVEFHCSTDPSFQAVPAKLALSFDFCPAYEVSVYDFSPGLPLEVN